MHVRDALDYVWGYTVVNDITARDLQFSEAQWSRCKSFDGFTPTGPVVVTADEVADPQDLWLTTNLDGRILQDASTNEMVRGVAEIISLPVAVGDDPARHPHLDGQPGRRRLLAQPAGLPARRLDRHRLHRGHRLAHHALPRHLIPGRERSAPELGAGRPSPSVPRRLLRRLALQVDHRDRRRDRVDAREPRRRELPLDVVRGS